MWLQRLILLVGLAIVVTANPVLRRSLSERQVGLTDQLSFRTQNNTEETGVEEEHTANPVHEVVAKTEIPPEEEDLSSTAAPSTEGDTKKGEDQQSQNDELITEASEAEAVTDASVIDETQTTEPLVIKDDSQVSKTDEPTQETPTTAVPDEVTPEEENPSRTAGSSSDGENQDEQDPESHNYEIITEISQEGTTDAPGNENVDGEQTQIVDVSEPVDDSQSHQAGEFIREAETTQTTVQEDEEQYEVTTQSTEQQTDSNMESEHNLRETDLLPEASKVIVTANEEHVFEVVHEVEDTSQSTTEQVEEQTELYPAETTETEEILTEVSDLTTDVPIQAIVESEPVQAVNLQHQENLKPNVQFSGNNDKFSLGAFDQFSLDPIATEEPVEIVTQTEGSLAEDETGTETIQTEGPNEYSDIQSDLSIKASLDPHTESNTEFDSDYVTETPSEEIETQTEESLRIAETTALPEEKNSDKVFQDETNRQVDNDEPETTTNQVDDVTESVDIRTKDETSTEEQRQAEVPTEIPTNEMFGNEETTENQTGGVPEDTDTQTNGEIEAGETSTQAENIAAEIQTAIPEDAEDAEDAEDSELTTEGFQMFPDSFTTKESDGSVMVSVNNGEYTQITVNVSATDDDYWKTMNKAEENKAEENKPADTDESDDQVEKEFQKVAEKYGLKSPVSLARPAAQINPQVSESSQFSENPESVVEQEQDFVRNPKPSALENEKFELNELRRKRGGFVGRVARYMSSFF